MVYYFDCFPNCKPPLTFAEVFWCPMYHENIKSKDNVIYVIPWVILTISFIWLAEFWIAGQDCSQVLECSHYNSFQVIFTIIQLNMDSHVWRLDDSMISKHLLYAPNQIVRIRYMVTKWYLASNHVAKMLTIASKPSKHMIQDGMSII